MDAEHPFSATDLGVAALWREEKLVAEALRLEGLIKRIVARRDELSEVESMLREKLASLVDISARRQICLVGEYPFARPEAPEPIQHSGPVRLGGHADAEILQVLGETLGNRNLAARRLGIACSTLGKCLVAMKKDGVAVPESPYRHRGREFSSRTGARRVALVKS